MKKNQGKNSQVGSGLLLDHIDWTELGFEIVLRCPLEQDTAPPPDVASTTASLGGMTLSGL